MYLKILMGRQLGLVGSGGVLAIESAAMEIPMSPNRMR